MEIKDFDSLLIEYRSIWNHRLLENEGESSESILRDAIERELRDENSHPRIRKNKYEKYHLAIKRLINSDLRPEEKLSLIHLHDEIVGSLE